MTLTIVALFAFLYLTPGGLLTKTDWIGYAVCHRIETHSLSIAGRQLPLCARCSGTFLGALVGFFGQAVVLRRRRAAEFPPTFIVAVLVGFMLLWAADGLNSYLSLFPGAPYLYEPRNWLRLVTGTLNGLTMSSLVYPILNITLWQNPAQERTIRNLRDLGVLLLLEVGMVGIVLTQLPFLLYPLALLSALGVVSLLTSVNSVIVLMAIQRENVAQTWREAFMALLSGLIVSLIQIAVIDIVRYTLTGTLEGTPSL